MDRLPERPRGELVVVFHRFGSLKIDDMPCEQLAMLPIGIICVTDEDDVLDPFAAFVAGGFLQDEKMNRTLQSEWRKVCRSLGHGEQGCSNELSFSSPEIMMSFT